MDPRDTTHRQDDEGALCGQYDATVSPCDAVVTCPTCLALIALDRRRRRTLVLRSLVLVGKLAAA